MSDSRPAHPLVELTLARIREFVREPEALFWTFGYPVVMSLALAFAFPSADAQPVLVGIAEGDGAAAIRETLAKTPGVTVREVAPGDQLRMLREGEIHILVEPTDPPTYEFDKARDESRPARLIVDNALKGAAGRTDPWYMLDNAENCLRFLAEAQPIPRIEASAQSGDHARTVVIEPVASATLAPTEHEPTAVLDPSSVVRHPAAAKRPAAPAPAAKTVDR